MHTPIQDLIDRIPKDPCLQHTDDFYDCHEENPWSCCDWKRQDLKCCKSNEDLTDAPVFASQETNLSSRFIMGFMLFPVLVLHDIINEEEKRLDKYHYFFHSWCRFPLRYSNGFAEELKKLFQQFLLSDFLN